MVSVGVVALLAMVAGVSSYDTGAPVVKRVPMMPAPHACTSGSYQPGHTVRGTKTSIFPSGSTSNYQLIVENPNVKYKHGTKVKLTLRGLNRNRFLGFFITGDAEDAVMGLKGTFEPGPRFANQAKQVEYCVLGITHKNKNPKSSVTVFWNPPNGFSHGRVQFRATVVENYDTFYTNILSNHTVDPERNLPTEKTHMQNQFNQMMGRMRMQGGGASGAPGGNMLQNLFNQMSQGAPGGFPQLPGLRAGPGGNTFPGMQG